MENCEKLPLALHNIFSTMIQKCYQPSKNPEVGNITQVLAGAVPTLLQHHHPAPHGHNRFQQISCHDWCGHIPSLPAVSSAWFGWSLLHCWCSVEERHKLRMALSHTRQSPYPWCTLSQACKHAPLWDTSLPPIPGTSTYVVKPKLYFHVTYPYFTCNSLPEELHNLSTTTWSKFSHGLQRAEKQQNIIS